MDIQTLSKIRDIIGEQIASYISDNVGKLHTTPHKEILAFAQLTLSNVTISLQKEIKPAAVSTKVVTKPVAESLVEEIVTEEVEVKKKGRPKKVAAVSVDKDIAKSVEGSKIKVKSKKKRLANKILESNGIQEEASDMEVSEPEVGFADQAEENDFTF